ncbi:MAG: hypothetical protein E5X67_25045 [Mesorhizobium sp.]|nr:MAG: hypothetical protein E5X67_25045 [Mesorhizobium sp.]
MNLPRRRNPPPPCGEGLGVGVHRRAKASAFHLKPWSRRREDAEHARGGADLRPVGPIPKSARSPRRSRTAFLQAAQSRGRDDRPG